MFTPEEEARSVEERKTQVTLTVQETRDALISKLDDINGACSLPACSHLVLTSVWHGSGQCC